jgi:biofilm PGA synthesis N-glycosyltransferase PgaC
VSQFEQKGDGLFIGSVGYSARNNLEKIFALEFLSLVGTGIGLAHQKHPVYMNGANYGITKRFLENTTIQSGQDYASGDDVFLLHDIKAQHGTDKIFTISINDNSVSTEAPETISSFIKQRIRWGGKTSGYKDNEALLLAGLIFSTCLLQIASFFLINQLLLFFSFWAGKIIVDLFALATYTKVFKQEKLLRWFPILAPLYPFYIVLTGITGIFTSTKYWDKS